MYGFSEKIPLRGMLIMRVYRSGVLIEKYREYNLIVNTARFQMARLIAGDTDGRHITHIAFGTSGTAPAAADTAITGQYVRSITGISFPENGIVQFDWELPVTENNGMAIREFGLLTADGTLF
ncbi:MAG: hypothetical protein LBF74_13500, partial [Treponema sp.]|nr:hypothetical protein [Treponema sp.]